MVTTKYILPEKVQLTVQLQRFAPEKRDYTSVKMGKKVVCASYLKRRSGSDRRVCAAHSLFYSHSEIHCVMFSFWRVFEAFGKLKQMGNREGTFC